MKLPTHSMEHTHVIPIRTITSPTVHADYVMADGDIFVVLPGADTKTQWSSYFFDASAAAFKNVESGDYPIIDALTANTGLRTVSKFVDLIYTGNLFKTVGYMEVFPISDPNFSLMFTGTQAASETYFGALQRLPGYRRIPFKDMGARTCISHAVINPTRNEIFRKYDEGATTTTTDPENALNTIVLRIHADNTGSDYTAQAVLALLQFELHFSVETTSSDAAYMHLMTPSPPCSAGLVARFKQAVSNVDHTVIQDLKEVAATVYSGANAVAQVIGRV